MCGAQLISGFFAALLDFLSCDSWHCVFITASKPGSIMLALHLIVSWLGLSIYAAVHLVAAMWLFCSPPPST